MYFLSIFLQFFGNSFFSGKKFLGFNKTAKQKVFVVINILKTYENQLHYNTMTTVNYKNNLNEQLLKLKLIKATIQRSKRQRTHENKD